ncbi:hypothetical protein CBFG_05629 [Clostridiales bacterium 1_7_47FAA]|nr:hypothetical protein CBFG_05629 [Clostridiales bacterium 1_7_47FAA]
MPKGTDEKTGYWIICWNETRADENVCLRLIQCLWPDRPGTGMN